MSLDELDHLISEWNIRLGAAAQNLVDLQALPVYQRLAGTNGVPQAQLSGETAAAVQPAMGTLSRLLLYFDLLQHTVMRAEELRQDIPLWGAEQRMREIEQLLTTASIRLPAEPVPLDRRSLLSGVDKVEAIAPENLLRLMAQAFEQVKGVVLMVDAAWEGLGRKIEDTVLELERLRPEADEPIRQSFVLVLRAVDEAKLRAETDPVAAAAAFRALSEPALIQIRAAVEQSRLLRREIETGFAVCRALLESLLTVHRDGVAAHAEVAGTIWLSAPTLTPAQDSVIAGLQEWLRRLEIKYREGTLKPIATGIRNWNKAAEQLVSSERGSMAANRELLDRRSELRGRLDALKAKARARGVAEDDALTSLAEKGHAHLAPPADLDGAAGAIEAYEKKMSGLLRI